eukprot:2436887-Rhodomonas_salina.1
MGEERSGLEPFSVVVGDGGEDRDAEELVVVQLPDDDFAELGREHVEALVAERVAVLNVLVEVDPRQDLLLDVRGDVVVVHEVHHRLRHAAALAREVPHG